MIYIVTIWTFIIISTVIFIISTVIIGSDTIIIRGIWKKTKTAFGIYLKAWVNNMLIMTGQALENQYGGYESNGSKKGNNNNNTLSKMG